MNTTRIPLISSVNLLGMPAAANDLCIALEPLLERFGIDPSLIEKPEGFLSLQSFVNCLEAVASEYDCPHFALLIARHRPALGFGVLGQLIKASPNVGAAMRNSHRHLKLLSENSLWDIEVESGLATLKRSQRHTLAGKQQQMLSLSIAQYFQLLRSLMGPGWLPASVSFTFRPSAGRQEYKRFFQAPVYFDQEFCGIRFPASDLEHRIPTSDPDMLRIIEQHIDSFEQTVGDSVKDKVSLIIRQLLDTGACSVEAVAAKMDIHPKKLQRELRKENTTFKALLKTTRLEVAEFYLQHSEIGLIQLAELLGYNAPSALTRSFKQVYGLSPQHWRQSRCGSPVG